MNTVVVPETAEPRRPQGTWLGFDFGMRRIGVASGQTATGSAGPLDVIANGPGGPDWNHLQRLLKEWRPVGVVVGLPLDAEGGETTMSRRARSFGRKVAADAGLEVAFQDERLSSRVAEEQFAAQRAAGSARRKDAARLDARAAAIILQNWLQSLTHEP